MNSIFGIGPLEFFFIAILALVILGPERLPGAIREGAKHFRTLRNMSGELTSQFSEELKGLDDINPKKIMNEMMEDLDFEEEKKALAELNPKKIHKDIKSGLNPMKAKSTKSAAAKKAEATAATAAVATAAAATTDTTTESAEPTPAQPLAEPKSTADDDSTVDASEVDAPEVDTSAEKPDGEVASKPVESAADVPVLAPADILARSQPKMTDPYAKVSKSKQASIEPEVDEDFVENRIAPDELAANIEAVESVTEPSPSTAPVNGTNDSAPDNPHDVVQDDTGDRA
jgi:sec-independent protein translocase protein TatB